MGNVLCFGCSAGAPRTRWASREIGEDCWRCAICGRKIIPHKKTTLEVVLEGDKRGESTHGKDPLAK